MVKTKQAPGSLVRYQRVNCGHRQSEHREKPYKGRTPKWHVSANGHPDSSQGQEQDNPFSEKRAVFELVKKQQLKIEIPRLHVDGGFRPIDVCGVSRYRINNALRVSEK